MEHVRDLKLLWKALIYIYFEVCGDLGFDLHSSIFFVFLFFSKKKNRQNFLPGCSKESCKSVSL